MAKNPYAPPVSSAEPVPVKRTLIKSGARMLFWGFLAPILAFLTRVMIVWTSLLANGGVKIVKMGKLPPPRTWDLDCVAEAGVEIVGALGGVGALLGVIMLSREPLTTTTKVSPWIRGGVLLVGGAWATLGFSKCICWFLQNSIYYNRLLMLELSGRWVPLLSSLWLIREIAALRSNASIYQRASTSIVVSLIALVIGAAADATDIGSFFVLVLVVPSLLLSFGTIWSAKRLETPPSDLSPPKKRAKLNRRTHLVSRDKAA